MTNPVYITVEIPEEQAKLIEQIQQDGDVKQIGYLQGVEINLDQTGSNQFYDVKFSENATLVIQDHNRRQQEASSILEKQIKSQDVFVNIVCKDQHTQYESVTNKVRKAIRKLE